MRTITIRYEMLTPEVGVVYLTGLLDIPGVDDIALKFTAFTATQRKPVIVDLSEVSMITSMGVGMLITAANTLRRHNASMILFNPQPNVERVLKMSGLDQIFTIEHDLDAAIHRISSKPNVS